jgi:hypothetical protein
LSNDSVLRPGTEMWRILRTAFTSVTCALLACSSPTTRPLTGPVDGANVDSSMLIVNLSAAEQAALCDWIAGQYGGYGHMAVCDAGAHAGNSSDPGTDQATCVMSLQHLASTRPTCQAKVGDGTACVQWVIQNPCPGPAAGPASCQVLASAACTTQ